MSKLIKKWHRCYSDSLQLARFTTQTLSKRQTIKYKETWTKTLEHAQNLVLKYNKPLSGEKSSLSIEETLQSDITKISDNMKNLIQTKTPLMNLATSYYFNQPGKHFRPLIVLLMSLATSLCENSKSRSILDFNEINRSISNKVPMDFHTKPYDSLKLLEKLEILPSQRRLAEITELIHTASLLHDDVLDNATSRRSKPSANVHFDNKISILAGDFLLGRASMALARLRQPEVFELLATVLSDLVEGEMMQLSTPPSSSNDQDSLLNFNYYLEKTYMKTASLMAKSCKAACVLGGTSNEISDTGYEYGKNLGLSFQVVDDILDFISTDEETGKAINVDLDLGLATAPVLYAAQEYPEQLWPLIHRKFSHPDDSNIARELVMKSSGIEKSQQLASKYSQIAAKAAMRLPPSSARDALIKLTNTVTHRRK